MSGHSKWANIKHKKEASDKKKGKIFSKLAKEIMVCVKQSGKDPNSNPRLRMALIEARSVKILTVPSRKAPVNSAMSFTRRLSTRDMDPREPRSSSSV